MKILETLLRIFGEFFRTFGEIISLIEEVPSNGDQQGKRDFEATVATKQPLRSDVTSDLKFMGQTTYGTRFGLFRPFLELSKKKNLTLLARVV